MSEACPTSTRWTEHRISPSSCTRCPERLRRRGSAPACGAFDPAFSFLDGLNDYDEDYTDAALVVEGLKTVYQVGKGMLAEDETKPKRTKAKTDGEG